MSEPYGLGAAKRIVYRLEPAVLTVIVKMAKHARMADVYQGRQNVWLIETVMRILPVAWVNVKKCCRSVRPKQIARAKKFASKAIALRLHLHRFAYRTMNVPAARFAVTDNASDHRVMRMMTVL